MIIVIGIFFIFALSVILGLFAWKFGLREKRVYILFLLSLLIHIAAVLFVYFAEFQPFSGGRGDYDSYHKSAELISHEIKKGNFFPGQELRGIDHYYPTIIGYVYYLTTPSMVIGQLFNAWVAALAIVFLYFLVLEVSGSYRWAFYIGLGANFYPSFLFYSSLLLKDVFVILFAMASALFMLRILKNFSWRLFTLFYLSLLLLTHFRFYVGVIMIIAFVLSWFFLSSKPLKKRIVLGLMMIILLGFIPQFFGKGYFGVLAFKNYIRPDTIAYYQETAYTGKDVAAKDVAVKDVAIKDVATEEPLSESSAKNTGFESTTNTKISFSSPQAFFASFPKALAFVSLGPFPWQLKEKKHYFVLLETIPWTFLAIFILLGIIHSIRKRHIALSLALFSGGLFLMLMIYMSNFGITTRIRMPTFLVLMSFIPFGFKLFIEKLMHNKILKKSPN